MKIFTVICILLIAIYAYPRSPDLLDQNLTEVFTSTQAEIEKKYHTRLSGYGVGAMHGLKRISMNFYLNGPLTIAEARRIVVDSSRLFRDRINSSENLRPFLIEYPFPSKRISLAFWLRDKESNPIRTPEMLYSVTLSENIIEYNMLKKQSNHERDDQKVLMHSETLDEAQRVVENE